MVEKRRTAAQVLDTPELLMDSAQRGNDVSHSQADRCRFLADLLWFAPSFISLHSVVVFCIFRLLTVFVQPLGLV